MITGTTEIYTLSLHDALPIYAEAVALGGHGSRFHIDSHCPRRSEEHTSELQSQSNLVCGLQLEKKNTGRQRLFADNPCAPCADLPLLTGVQAGQVLTRCKFET